MNSFILGEIFFFSPTIFLLDAAMTKVKLGLAVTLVLLVTYTTVWLAHNDAQLSCAKH